MVVSKHILITGAAGFIGHALVDHVLLTTDWNVVCLDRLDHAGNLNRLTSLRSFSQHRARVRVVFHDLRAAINKSVASQLLGGAIGFDHVVHMAAGSHVDRSILDPAGFVLDNVLGTAHLLDFCRDVANRTLLFSTDEVVGPAGPNDLFAEDARMNPNNPYSATKAGGELLGPAYANTYGMNIVVTRCANAFGALQDPEKFVPLVIRKILKGEVVSIHARRVLAPYISHADDPEYHLEPATRLYTHVSNVTSAVLHVLEHGEPIQGEDANTGRFNISGGEEQDNLDVAKKIAKLMGRELRYELVVDPPGRPRPDMRYSIDASKLRKLGWSPTVGFEEGLKRVVESELESLQ